MDRRLIAFIAQHGKPHHPPQWTPTSTISSSACTNTSALSQSSHCSPHLINRHHTFARSLSGTTSPLRSSSLALTGPTSPWSPRSTGPSRASSTLAEPPTRALPGPGRSGAKTTKVLNSEGAQEISVATTVPHAYYARDWTLESNTALMRWREQGVPWRTIGKRLDKPAGSCLDHYRKVLLPAFGQASPLNGHTWTAAMDATLLEKRLADGMSWRKVGLALGKDTATCRVRFLGALEPILKSKIRLEETDVFNEILKARAGLQAKEILSWYNRFQQTHKPRGRSGKQSQEKDDVLTGLSPLTAGSYGTGQLSGTWRRGHDEKRQLAEPLTVEQVKRLERLVSLGWSWQSIGTLLGVSSTACQEHWQSASESDKSLARDLLKKQDFLASPGIERYYDDQDWEALMKNHHSRESAVVATQGPHKARLEWLEQQPTWTVSLETRLIRQVILHGVGDWDLISKALGGQFSPEACRIRWKNLDMPVVLEPVKPKELERLHDNDSLNDSEMGWYEAYSTTPENGLASSDDHSLVPYSQGDMSIPKRRVWSKERSMVLQNMIRLQTRRTAQGTPSKRIRWQEIAGRIGGDVTVQTCKLHREYLKQAQTLGWSRDEIKLLESGIRQHGEVWRDIQKNYLPWRDPSTLRPQWLQISDRAAKITVDEYMTLHRTVEELGESSWRAVAARMPGWTANPCRRAWESSFRFLLGNTVFTPEEDAWMLKNVPLDQRQEWEAVAKRFKNEKSPWQCRLRWCALLSE